MSEMLGNQYFLARKYKEALNQFEPLLAKNEFNKSIVRKLIIIYSQMGKISKALSLFEKLVKYDIKFIVDADPTIDDCPCEEIIQKNDKIKKDSFDSLVYLGILWLYCNPKKSLEYLKLAQQYNPQNRSVQQVVKQITNFLNG